MEVTSVLSLPASDFVAVEDVRMLAKVIYSDSGAMYPHPEALESRDSFSQWFLSDETLSVYFIRELHTGMLLATGTIGLLKDDGLNKFPSYLVKLGFSLARTVELGRLMSEPRARGNGFGKAIIDRALEDYADKTVIACVNREDSDVSQWYRRNKFQSVGDFMGKRGNMLDVYRFDA